MERPWTDQPKGRIPAWAMSALLHVVVIVAATLLWRSAAPVSRGATESSRTGAIVVAVSANGETEYFDESDAVSDASSTGASAPSAPAEALPSAAPLPDLPDIALPGDVQGSVSGDLLEGSDLNLQGGAGLPAGGDLGKAVEEIARREAAMRGPPPVGTPAELKVFGAASVGRSFVFVIDRSKSMGGAGLGALLAAQKELERGLSELTPSQRFEIVVYHQTPDSFGKKYNRRSGLMKVTKERVEQVHAFFESLVAFGSTQHYYALNAALDLRPEVIYLLTDGGSPYLNPGQLNRVAARAKNGGCTIHSIQFGFGPQQEEDHFMMSLASRTGGSYTYHRMAER